MHEQMMARKKREEKKAAEVCSIPAIIDRFQIEASKEVNKTVTKVRGINSLLSTYLRRYSCHS